MRKFLLQSLLLSAVLIALYTLLAFIVNPSGGSGNDYMSAMEDKHQRITDLNGPKLIFAGGSNLAFGLNSERVEQQFSVPVVNLSLNAGLGLDFIIEELKSVLIEGDVVVISIEYFLSLEGQYEVKKNTSNQYEEAIMYYDFDLKKELVMHMDRTRGNLKSFGKEALDEDDGHVYSRDAFNVQGDIIAHLEEAPLSDPNIFEIFRDRDWKIKYELWEGITQLNDLQEFAIEKKAKLYYMYPNYPISGFEKKGDIINRLHDDISRNLQIEILNEPIDCIFEDSLFYDTAYHLNKTGREIRTDKVIELLTNTEVLHSIETIKELRGN